MINNLGATYVRLGIYGRAVEFAERAVALSRQVGARVGLAHSSTLLLAPTLAAGNCSKRSRRS